MTPQRVIDFKKIQWADYFYVTQCGIARRMLPDGHTVNGLWFNEHEMAPHHPLFPGETLLARAKRLKLLDTWTPVCKLHVTANRTLTYRGEAAKKMWKNYGAHIYGK